VTGRAATDDHDLREVGARSSFAGTSFLDMTKSLSSRRSTDQQGPD